jgi:hypothetical protein
MENAGVHLTESSEVRTQRIMAEAVAAKEQISVRLNAQIKDWHSNSYKGMPGYSIVFKVSSPAMVEKAFAAIEEALRSL